MRMSGRIDDKNRVTITKSIREDLRLEKGEKINVNIKNPKGGMGRNATLKLNGQGRVTIPEHIRESLKLESGETVELQVGSPETVTRYWDEGNWNDFFSNLSMLTSSNNPIVKLKNKLEAEWDGENLSDVYPEYEEFFQPEKVSEVEIQKPWFLRFFDICFFSQGQKVDTYDGIVFRLEEGTGLEEVRINVREKSIAPSRYFTQTRKFDDIIEKAANSGVGIKEKEPQEITLSSPEDVSEQIRSFFQTIMNSIVGHDFWPLILSLSHGTTEKYARKCYKGFDEDLIFDMLEYKREANFGLMKDGGHGTLSGILTSVWDKLTDSSGIEKVASCAGFEPIPDPANDYLEENYRSFKEQGFEKAESLLQKIRSAKDGIPYGKKKVGKLAREVGVPIGDLLRGLAPLLFLGILTYSNGKINFSELRELEEK